MRCFRCGQNNAVYEVFLSSPQGDVRELLCEKCFSSGKFPAQARMGARPIQTASCPYCGMTMSEYLQTGLVGCAQCYSVFAKELAPYIVRLHGDGEHRGKVPAQDGKYELAQAVREAEDEAQRAREAGNMARVKLLENKAAELKLALFGDDDEDDEGREG